MTTNGDSGSQRSETQTSQRDPFMLTEREHRIVADAERFCLTRLKFYPSDTVEESYESLVSALNTAGVAFLRKGRVTDSYRYLSCAEALTTVWRPGKPSYAEDLQAFSVNGNKRDASLLRSQSEATEREGSAEEENWEKSLVVPGPITDLLRRARGADGALLRESDRPPSSSRHAIEGLRPHPAPLTSQPLRKSLRARTLSNIGCYLVRVGRTKEALHYFTSSLSLEVDVMKKLEQLLTAAETEPPKATAEGEEAASWMSASETGQRNEAKDALSKEALLLRLRACKASVAASHLNICAALSAVVRHGKALSHAQGALSVILKIHPAPPRSCLNFLVEEEVRLALSADPATENDAAKQDVETIQEVEEEDGREKADETETINMFQKDSQNAVRLLYSDAEEGAVQNEIKELLVVALFNVGAELEFLGELDSAVKAFYEAYSQSNGIAELTRISRNTLKAAYTELDYKCMKKRDQSSSTAYPSFLSIPPESAPALSLAKTQRLAKAETMGNASEAPSSKPYNVHSVTRRSAVRAVRKQRFVAVPKQLTSVTRRSLAAKQPYLLAKEITASGLREAKGRQEGYVSLLAGYEENIGIYGAVYGERYPRKAQWVPDSFKQDVEDLARNPAYAETLERQKINRQRQSPTKRRPVTDWLPAVPAPPSRYEGVVDPQVLPRAAAENRLVEKLKASVGEAEYEGAKMRRRKRNMYSEDLKEGKFIFPPIHEPKRKDRMSAFGPSQYILMDRKPTILPDAFGYRSITDSFANEDVADEKRAPVSRYPTDLATEEGDFEGSHVTHGRSAIGTWTGGLEGLTEKVQKALEVSFRGDILDVLVDDGGSKRAQSPPSSQRKFRAPCRKERKCRPKPPPQVEGPVRPMRRTVPLANQ